jgi:hypothetical protein
MAKNSKEKKTKQVEIVCPLRDTRFKLTRIQRHVNKNHPDISLTELENAIEEGLKNGTLQYKVTLYDGLTKTRSGTRAVAGRKHDKGGVRGIVLGGAIELGKRYR